LAPVCYHYDDAVCSDEEFNGNTTTPAEHVHTTCAESGTALDAASVTATTPTLLASDINETLSRDPVVSTNHVAASASYVADDVTADARRGDRSSYVSRVDADAVGPPWLPGSKGTLLQSDALPSLQHGASGLLALVYDRQTNLSPTTQQTAVPRSTCSSSTSSSPSITVTTAATLQSQPDVNIDTVPFGAGVLPHDAEASSGPNAHDRKDTACVVSGSLVEYHRPEPSSDSTVETSPSSSSTPNSHQCGPPSVDCTSGDTDDVTRDVAADELPARSTDGLIHIEDYLLSDWQETRRELVNGTSTSDDDDDDVHVLNELDCRDAENDGVTTTDAAGAPEGTANSVTEVGDASSTRDVRRPVNECQSTSCDLPLNDMSPIDDTTTILSCSCACPDVEHGHVYVNGYLPGHVTDSDTDDLRRRPDTCSVCSDDASPSSLRHSDINSNVTSLDTPAITTSGDDEVDADDVEECRRVAERMSAAWSGSDGHVEQVLDYYHDNMDAELEPQTSSTLTGTLTDVRRSAALHRI